MDRNSRIIMSDNNKDFKLNLITILDLYLKKKKPFLTLGISVASLNSSHKYKYKNEIIIIVVREFEGSIILFDIYKYK